MRSIAILLLAATVHAEALRMSSIGGGARGLSLGEGGGAAAFGVESLFWGPAGISRIEHPEFMLGHTAWAEGLTNEAAGAVLPLGELGVLGAVGSWQTMPGIEERDASGALIRTFSLTTGSGQVAWARGFGDVWSAGVSTGFQIQDGLDINESAVPLGAGVQADLGSLVLGVSGVGILLPQPAVHVSGSWRTSFGIPLLLTGGVILQSDESRTGIGIEASLGGVLQARVGYVMPVGETDLQSFSNLSGGLGLSYRMLGIDYAFLPLGELGQVHRVQATLKLGGGSSGSANTGARIPGPAVANTGPAAPASGAQPSAKPEQEVEMEFVVPSKTTK